jgi:hypothetical protein
VDGIRLSSAKAEIILLFQQQMTIETELCNKAGIAGASWNLGEYYRQIGEYAGAVREMSRFIEYLRSINHSDIARFAGHVAETAELLKEQVGDDRGEPTE